MTDLAFLGYRFFDAAPDDPLRLKWNEMRGRLEVLTLATPEPTLIAVADFNAKINRMIAFDRTEAESLDAWQSPSQTLQRERGDCKDFALVKYAVLTKAGIPVRIVLGEIKTVMKANPKHAWCAAFIEGAWRALDNMFDQIIKIEEYSNWIPTAALHDDAVVEFGSVFSIAEQLAKQRQNT